MRNPPVLQFMACLLAHSSGKNPTPKTLAPALSLPTCGVVHGLLLSRLSPLRLLARPLSQLCRGAST